MLSHTDPRPTRELACGRADRTALESPGGSRIHLWLLRQPCHGRHHVHALCIKRRHEA